MKVFEFIQQGGLIMYVLILFNIVGFTIMLAKLVIISREQKLQSSTVDSLSLKIKDHERKDIEAVIELAKQELGSYVSGLEKGLNTVKIIATVSPLLGLLGTVIGVLVAFRVMSESGLANPSVFAQGISMALITTVGGMIVAIPHYIGHNYLIGMLDSLESKLEKDIISRVV